MSKTVTVTMTIPDRMALLTTTQSIQEQIEVALRRFEDAAPWYDTFDDALDDINPTHAFQNVQVVSIE